MFSIQGQFFKKKISSISNLFSNVYMPIYIYIIFIIKFKAIAKTSFCI